MKTVWEVWVERTGGTLEPVLDTDGAGALEYDAKQKADDEAKHLVNEEDDAVRAFVVEKRAVEEYVANPEGRPAAPAQSVYKTTGPASDMLVQIKEHYVDVSCPCGCKTPFTREAVVASGDEGTVAKCLKCKRLFKIVGFQGGFTALNVEPVPAAG